MNEEIIKQIMELEEKYRCNNYNGVEEGKCNYKIIKGTIPIILSAPHAVNQNREGKIKGPDILTGAIVQYLAIRTGVSGIIRTYNFNDDPNYENQGQSLKYKEEILNLIKEKNIKILIDVHGCKDNHGFDIDLGTNYGENINQDNSCLEILKAEFSKIGKVVLDNKFRASRDTTVSNFINKNSKIPCIQMEISSRIRRNSENLISFLEIFEKLLKEQKILGGERIKNDEISR